MVYLIIALAMLFILGPIFMLRPSPRARRKMRMRERALALGLKVAPISLQRDKKFNALLQRNPHIENHQWYRYQRLAEEGEPGPGTHGEWWQRKTRDGNLVWEASDFRLVTPPPVQQLIEQWQQQQTADFLAIELGPRSAAIIWNERGDVAEVETLAEQLQDLLWA
ncbi:MAG: hypothetical protein SV765_01305 [Pseudomonadota bacterium]|nr:hypothetical protein [Pseudomonadales bacterium]MDY6918830.1 hypothetical protein [Pseudomonadota bacterium]